jgi:hypothetical protein
MAAGNSDNAGDHNPDNLPEGQGPESFRALCADFYVNHKLQVKLELPKARETVLDLFERVRRQFPHMSNFKRYRDELALESTQAEMPHRWMAIKGTHLRSGVVNAESLRDAISLHSMLLEAAPNYLSISPLDVDYVELLFGFDLLASGNHDSIVLDALLDKSPLHELVDIPTAHVTDFQPAVGLSLGKGPVTGLSHPGGNFEVYFEVKTRPTDPKVRDAAGPAHVSGPAYGVPSDGEPISVYLTLRKFGPVGDIRDLPAILNKLARTGQDLIENRLVPGVLVPLREAISSGNA